MKKYGRWIVFGLLAVGIVVLLLVVGANKNLRQKLIALLLEKKVKTEISNLKDKATAAKTLADAGKMDAKEAEAEAAAAEEAISKQKKDLEKGLEKRGFNADEITDRLRNLSV